MSKSAQSVMDFQDIAWYMTAVYFKTPEGTTFFSQRKHFQYSLLNLLPMQTMMTGEIDYYRTELIRHHKTLRSQQNKVSGSFDDLESTQTTFIEMKNETRLESGLWSRETF